MLVPPGASSRSAHPATGAGEVFRPGPRSGAQAARSPPVFKETDERGVLSSSSDPPGFLGPGLSAHPKTRGPGQGWTVSWG